MPKKGKEEVIEKEMPLQLKNLGQDVDEDIPELNAAEINRPYIDIAIPLEIVNEAVAI